MEDIRHTLKIIEEELVELRAENGRMRVVVESFREALAALDPKTISNDAAKIVRQGFFQDMGEVVYKKFLWVIGALVFVVGSALIGVSKLKFPWGHD